MLYIKKLFRNSFRYLLLLYIPLYFLLDGINQYRGMMPFNAGFRIVTIIIVISASCAFLLNKKIDTERTLLITAWLLFCYLFFKVIIDKLSQFKILKFLTTAYYYLPFFALLFVSLLYWLHKTNIQKRKKLLLYLNILFLTLCLYELYKFISAGTNAKFYQLVTDKVELSPIITSKKPNIYLLVLDEYAGLKSTREYFKYDNTSFFDSLQKRNFFVVKNSRSNYNMTLASMLSTLEMGYIKNYDKNEFRRISIYGLCAEALKENNVMDFFNSNGYKILNNTFFNLNNSKTEPFLMLPVEDRLLMDKTFGRVVTNGVLQNIPNNKIHFVLNTQFAKIYTYNDRIIKQTYKSIHQHDTPFFMYSHFILPHLPYLKDKNGTPRKFSIAYNELRNRSIKQPYIDQLQYTNKLLISITDSVIKKDNNAIIIVMSDHGYRWSNNQNKYANHFDNMLAVFKSDLNYQGFTDSTCLVNLFRILLNNTFEQNLSLYDCNCIDAAEGHIK